MKFLDWLLSSIRMSHKYYVNISFKYHKSETKCLIVYNISKFRLIDLKIEIITLKGIKIIHVIDSISVKMAVPINLNELFEKQSVDDNDSVSRVNVTFKNTNESFTFDETGKSSRE